MFYKIALKAPSQILMRIPSFIYVVPNLMRDNHFIDAALMVCPLDAFVKRRMLLLAGEGFEAESARH